MSFIVFLGTFAPIVSAHPYCARKITCHVMHRARALSNGNRTEWSPIQSVIILVINKSDSRCAVFRFCYHSYDYRLYYIHFEITGYPFNVIGSQWCDLFPNRTIFCSKSHLFLTQEEGDSKTNQNNQISKLV